MSEETNKDIIRKIYKALESGDRSVYGKYVDPNYVWRLPGHCSWSRRFEGREAIQRDLLKPLFAMFATTYTAKAINLIAEGDYVVAEVRGDVQTKHGERYNNEYCFVFKFSNGKIVEIVEYCDTDLEVRVLGPYEDAIAAVQ